MTRREYYNFVTTVLAEAFRNPPQFFWQFAETVCQQFADKHDLTFDPEPPPVWIEPKMNFLETDRKGLYRGEYVYEEANTGGYFWDGKLCQNAPPEGYVTAEQVYSRIIK